MGILYLPGDSRISLQPGSGASFETTAGSGLRYWIGAVQTHTPEESEGYEAQRYVGAGSQQDVAQFTTGKTTFKGTMVCYPQSHVILPYAFGANVDAGSPAYTHTITASGATLPTFQVEDCRETAALASQNINKTFIGCTIDTLNIKGSPGEPLELTTSFIARTGSFTRNAASAFGNKSGADLEPLKWDGVAVQLSGAGLWNNATLTELTGFEFGVNRNMNAPYYLSNTRNIGQPVPQNRDYSLSLNTYLSAGTGADLYSILRNGSEVNINLWLFRVSGTNAALSDYWQVWMSGCKMMTCTAPTAKEGTLSQDMEFQPAKAGVIVKQADLNYFATPSMVLI